MYEKSRSGPAVRVVIRVVIRDVTGALLHRSAARPDGVGPTIHDLVPAWANLRGFDARCELEISTAVDIDGELDLRGSAVHGKRGDRFVYLTPNTIQPDTSRYR